ncbi:MAG TPA: glycosyltransferase, partial [Tepidisphaeraceae bacterium]|nr:glycosyltransferase [Tepidisphaeraceae bacterium]
MRVFMLGWEFPPFISGGLGTACYGLTKAMSGIGTDIVFVIPRPVSNPFSTHVRLVSPQPGGGAAQPVNEFRLDEFENVSFRPIDAQISPYNTPANYDVEQARRERESAAGGTVAPSSEHGTDTARQHAHHSTQSAHNPLQTNAHYAGNLFEEVARYANMAADMARREQFDVIHAHDWMTYPAGLAVAGLSGKPLVVHVHSTEFDRAGAGLDQRIYDIERRGMHAAIKVIAVSALTKSIITRHYGIDPAKVEVVYNAIETNGNGLGYDERYNIHKDEKIVLFLGRITMQKGPEYFLAAAKKVLEVMDNVKFVMAGSGDLIRKTIELAAAMGIGHKVLFTGFLRGADVDRVFKMADLYVMPSVSEPFGIAPLEAMSHDVPVIISKQSGVSEVIQNALKVDFWDVDEMANKIIAVLRHPPLSQTLRQHGSFEIRRMSWA